MSRPSPLADGSAHAIREELDRILASPAFSAAERRKRLLRFLVERALQEDRAALKESVIAVEVFERDPAYDPKIDSVVRVEIGRLRSRLLEYYSTQGQSDAVRIDIPKGSYCAVFTLSGREAGTTPVAESTSAIPLPDQPARGHIGRLWLAMAAAAVLLASVGLWKVSRRQHAAVSTLSVAVLPFLNLTGNPSNDYLGDGITEELTEALAESGELRVVARTSAFQFKGRNPDIRQVGSALAAAAIVEGSLGKDGDQMRIIVKLIRAADGYRLWSHSYQTSAASLASTEAEIAWSVHRALQPGQALASPPEPSASTNNPEAHDLYLRGNYQFALHTPESYKKSLELFEQALQRDPSYVSAYLGLAKAETNLVHITAMAPGEGVPRARAALEKALALNPHSAATHGLLAWFVYTYDWDWPRAEREFQLALARSGQSNAHSMYAWSLATRGRFAEAQTHFQIARQLDPLNFSGPYFNQFMARYLEHNYPEAKRILSGMLKANPEAVDAHFMLGVMAAAQHDCGEAAKQFEWCFRKFSAPVTKIGLAISCACRSDGTHARRYLQDASARSVGAFVSPYQLAMGYAYLHDNQAAIYFLEKSAAAKEGQILYLKYEPFFDGIRSDVRYIALEKRVGLEP
jgi:serine/threonine-protein kinase